MKRTALVFCATFVLAFALSFTRGVSAQQQPPVATAGAQVAWDYADADIAAGAVVRFEIQVDVGAWSDVGMTKLAGAAATYAAPIPALQTGQHTVSVRACNTNLCGDATSPLAFVLAVKPATAKNLRVIGG
jgi:hypothetical protein